ncbi:LamG-like jellyroll fold domain-containing protein [Streptomyces xinghaiensis]|uniref:LamG-like jellyroll fold domain-containing protein n=1 Tax=Streptomyces xinghaiensis TaxID=1038928 RepID=UPI0037B99935
MSRRARLRGLRLALTAGLGMALAVGQLPADGGVLIQSAAAAAPARPAAGGDGSSPAVLSEDEALTEARRTGNSVEVTSLRRESSDVHATPEGNLEVREYLRPVRSRGTGGEWRPIDTELAKFGGGRVGPKSATLDLTFSGGGDGPLVRMKRAGRELALSWPTALPEPALAADTATYPEVLPGVDLRMGAQADGFSQLLVVKTAKAAESPELAELRLALAADGMTVRETGTGGLEAVDGGAKTAVFEAPTPLMWDSSPGEGARGLQALRDTRTSQPAAPAVGGGGRDGEEPGAGESGKLAPIAVEVGTREDTLVLRPDAEVLKGQDTVYPVFIDPQWHTPRASAWTMASKYWSSSPQWKFNGKSTEGLGYCGWNYCAPQDTKRLFYRIPTSRFAGKNIISAEFVVRSTWAASCSNREVQLWRTKGISTSTTWNSQNASGFWIDKLATRSFAYGYEGCSAKDAEFSVKSAVQQAANGKWSTMTFGLRASSESDRYGWKRFSDKAFLRVQYNRPPPQLKMSQLTMEYGGTCKKPERKARVRSLGTISANNVTDPDKDPVSVQFQAKWDTGDGKGLIVRWKPKRTSSKRSGSRFAIKLPSSVPENKTVHWYARSHDGHDYSPWSHAGSPTGCYFVRDTAVPAAPVIASDEYPASDPEHSEDPWFDGVGRYGGFTLDSPESDVVRYRYGINTDPLPESQITTSGGAARAAKVLPSRPGLHFVTAQAFDTAGNGSEISTYQFRVKAGQPERATWQLDEGTGAKQAGGSTPPRVAELRGGAETGKQGTVGTALRLNGTDGYAFSDIPVVDTNRGFTVSAWVKLSELPDHAAVIAAQPGNHSPGFELYYSAAYDRWVFNQYAADEPGAQIVRAMADEPGGVRAGEWTHLVGSYNGVERHLSLYVNGQQVGRTSYPGAWNARRGFQIGAGSYSGVPGAFFPGAIDELQIFDKLISTGEVERLHRKERIGDPGRPATAVFELDEAPGAAEVTGHGGVLPAEFHGGATPGVPGVADKALALNGTDGYARVGAPHLNTSRSFAVSAWVKLDTHKPSTAAIIAAQAGRDAPGFELYYSAHYDRWVFNQYSSDAPDAKPIRALPDEGVVARAGEWVHLVGVHDTEVNTLTLYINARKAGTTDLAGAFYANGPLLIGAGQYGSDVTAFFPGQIDDVRLFDRPVSSSEVQQLYTQRPLVKSRWKLDETAGTSGATTPDASAQNNALALHGGPEIGPGFIDGGLMLDGVDDSAATSTVPVDTGGSFTVTAWAQAAALPEEETTLVSAEGTRQNAFDVAHVPGPAGEDSPGRWKLAVPDRDAADASVTEVGNGNFYDVRDWNHLALVYDGFAKEARLYANGSLEDIGCVDTDDSGDPDDPSCVELIPWAEDALSFKAVESLQIGRAKSGGAWGQHWPGAVDDVWTFQGALTEDQVFQLANTWFDLPTEVPSG